MRRRAIIAAVVLGAVVFLAVGFLFICGDRQAGSPSSLADLEGEWVLDNVRGSFASAPPKVIRFAPGATSGLIQMSDGTRSADFELWGLGLFKFSEGTSFSPLLPEGESEVYTMTHLCPPLPEWDHLNFFPDGMPVGRDSNRRTIRYERE